MAWEETNDAERFWRATEGFMRERRIDLTVPLSIIDSLRAGGSWGSTPPRLAWFRDEPGDVAAVVVETPPHRPVVSSMPATAIVALAGRREAPARMLGPVPTVHALAAAWNARADDEIAERLHRLDQLTLPARATPTRVAGRGDAAAVWDAVRDFHREATPQDPPPRRAMVEAGLERGRYVVAVVDDVPVALAAITPTVLGVARIGPVYTPPAHRSRGHGASVTAAAVRLAHDHGAEEVLLFTDLANPTSNALYSRLGFVGVSDHVDAALVPVTRTGRQTP
jgi:ribosomal protein S18 acetylase RimI-like enzyme